MKRMLCIRLKRDDCKLPIENGKLQIRRLVEQFSPIVGIEPTEAACGFIAPESLLLDITGLAHLFGGEAALAAEIFRDFTRLGLNVRVGIADTIGAAWAAAHYGRGKAEDCKLHCSSDDTAAFLSPLPIEALRLPEETVGLLHQLGIASIGQAEALPREELSSRFGPVLLERLDQAFGRLDESVPACPVPPTFAAQWSFEHPTTRRETIEAAVEHLVRRVAAMLARCGRGAVRLECRLDLDIHHPPSTIRHLPLSVGLFQPTAEAEHLFQLVRLQLERLRTASPVTVIYVAAALTAPLQPRKQAMLFEFDDDNRPHPRHLASLVERLSSRLGRGAVLGVRLRPEAQPEFSWQYDPLVENRRRRRPRKTLPADLPPRPLRLLPRPLRLAATGFCGAAVPAVRAGGTPAPPLIHGPPLRLHLAGREHLIAQSWGPERIETGWWRGRLAGRDYFRVETNTGRRFWLFRRLRDEKWFLQGMFE
jgi:protein ImuB